MLRVNDKVEPQGIGQVQGNIEKHYIRNQKKENAFGESGLKDAVHVTIS